VLRDHRRVDVIDRHLLNLIFYKKVNVVYIFNLAICSLDGTRSCYSIQSLITSWPRLGLTLTAPNPHSWKALRPCVRGHFNDRIITRMPRSAEEMVEQIMRLERRIAFDIRKSQDAAPMGGFYTIMIHHTIYMSLPYLIVLPICP
jgi:hypothetical protein